MSNSNTVGTGILAQCLDTGVNGTVDTGILAQCRGQPEKDGWSLSGLDRPCPGTGVNGTVGTCLDGTPLDQRVLLAKNIKPPVVVIDRAVPMPAMARILYFQGTAGPLSCQGPCVNVYAKEA